MGRTAKNPAFNPAQKPDPKPNDGLPEAPAWLDDIAKEEWNRIGPLLLAAGLMTHVDYGPLAIYCVNWSRFVRNEAILRSDGKGETYTTDKSMYPIQSPELNISVAAQKQMLAMLKEFGLSPAARASLKIDNKPSDANKLITYLTKRPVDQKDPK